MKSRFVRIVTCFAASGLFLAGCGGGQQGSDPSARSGLILTSEVDKASSRVILPADRFALSDHEHALLSSAADVTIAVCAKEKLGLSWRPFRVLPESERVRGMWYELGPWTKEMASTYASVKPMPKPDLIANGHIPDDRSEEEKTIAQNGQLSDAERQKIKDECLEYGPRAEFEEDAMELYKGVEWKEINEANASLINHPEVEKVRQELATCYESVGLTMGKNGQRHPSLDPAQADLYTINEEQIGIALKTVECKDKVNAIPRIAQAWAGLQAPIIEEYADEFIAQRQRIDQALEKAKKYIADHPEAFDTTK